MRRLITNLRQFDSKIDVEQIADILWLAQCIGGEESADLDEENVLSLPTNNDSENVIQPKELLSSVAEPSEPSALMSSDGVSVSPAEPMETEQPDEATVAEQMTLTPKVMPIRVAAARSLREPIELERSLRPLMRKVPSRSRKILDEVSTAEQIAETQMRIPVLQPDSQRWLDLALVVEETSLTEIWSKTIEELQELLEHLGAFRDVRVWTMRRTDGNTLELFPRHRRKEKSQRTQTPKALIDPSGQRLIWVLTDCTSISWWSGKIHEWVKNWAKVNLVTIVQLFPQRLWDRGVLGEGLPVQLHARRPGASNQQWQVNGLPSWRAVELEGTIAVPVVTLEPEALKQWALAVVGQNETATLGVLFEGNWHGDLEGIATDPFPMTSELSAVQLVSQFRSTASPAARRLAILMAATPVNLQVVELLQETMLPESQQVHVAEVYLSGMLEQRENGDFEFRNGVRHELRKSLSRSQALSVLEEMSNYIAARLGRGFSSFVAFLTADLPETESTSSDVRAFAEIAVEVLRQMGGEFAAFAEEVSQRRLLALPEEGRLQKSKGEDWTNPPLETYQFETAKLELTSKKAFQSEAQIVITRELGQAQRYIERLTKEVGIEMVMIPEGTFYMGASRDELESLNQESPQHEVTISEFFIGQHPITQAQWQAVALWSQVDRRLNPDPSRFKGKDLPVDSISWQDAIEFCQRLAQRTGAPYRLPSEAEWEYACRAGTQTPFNFGDTITSELANYHGISTYGDGLQGLYREQTTSVGIFPANKYGLYDTHGNVWEWCQDHWREDYTQAPADSRAWTGKNVANYSYGVLRGGSWLSDADDCRSATRRFNIVGGRILDYGFRIACSASRTVE